jgi:hypothetical protein
MARIAELICWIGLLSFSLLATAEKGKNQASADLPASPHCTEADLGLDAIIAIDRADPNVGFCI